MLEIEMAATAVWLAVSMVLKGVVLAPVMMAMMEMALVRLLLLLLASTLAGIENRVYQSTNFHRYLLLSLCTHVRAHTHTYTQS